MARRADWAGYGDSGYGQGGSGGQGRSQQGRDWQGGRDGRDYYAEQGRYAQRSPYSQTDSYAQQTGGAQQSPYAQQGARSQADPYAQQARGGGRASRRERGAGTYPAGAGRVYESSRGQGQGGYGQQAAYGQQGGYGQQAAYGQGSSPYGYGQQQPAYGQAGYGQDGYQASGGASPYGAAAPGPSGVRPVTGQEYRDALKRGGKGGEGGPKMTRRKAIGLAGALAGLAVLGVAGGAWYTHRAVECTVNGTQREAPVGSTAAQIVSRGYASPAAGNLVSICAEGETPEVLERGGGEPYSLIVNGEPVDVAAYRLAEGDDLLFQDGADVTEQVTAQNTEIPCGIQIPPDTDYLSVIGYVSQWGRNGVSTVETGSVSGKVIDRGVTTQPQDLVIAHTGVNPADGRRLIALTFDDGPSLTYTPQYLDILARYGAKATFFNLGLNLEEGEEYVALCKRCADEGHQVSSHTYSHDDRTLSGFDEAGRNEEIAKGFQLVSQATGVATEVMRPPYGEFRGYQFLQYLAHAGDIAYSAFWGVDSQDWELLGADHIISQCTVGLNADSYNGAVILMHDGGGDRSQDVAALPTLIETYQSYGYQLVTLNEMLQADPTFPEWVWSGYVQRPDWAVIPDITAYVS